jgi:hypothetical protein
MDVPSVKRSMQLREEFASCNVKIHTWWRSKHVDHKRRFAIEREEKISHITTLAVNLHFNAFFKAWLLLSDTTKPDQKTLPPLAVFLSESS